MKIEMRKLPSEVLIYIQNLRAYLDSNDEIKKYFIINEDEDFFYNQVSQISQFNLSAIGEPLLSVEQFENIRTLIIRNFLIKLQEDALFVDYKEYGKFCLN
jgi:hypothetical protein